MPCGPRRHWMDGTNARARPGGNTWERQQQKKNENTVPGVTSARRSRLMLTRPEGETLASEIASAKWLNTLDFASEPKPRSWEINENVILSLCGLRYQRFCRSWTLHPNPNPDRLGNFSEWIIDTELVWTTVSNILSLHPNPNPDRLGKFSVGKINTELIWTTVSTIFVEAGLYVLTPMA